MHEHRNKKHRRIDNYVYSIVISLEHNVQYIDGPVSGGPQGALNGTLSVMLGGDAQSIAKCTPYMQMYAQKILHMGDVGK
jgi:3-hydroxyisobutyrate dehydrogenase-like beta-hydroxyacid dehydrogenase